MDMKYPNRVNRKAVAIIIAGAIFIAAVGAVMLASPYFTIPIPQGEDFTSGGLFHRRTSELLDQQSGTQWTPDGKHIVFMVQEKNSTYVVDREGTKLTAMTKPTRKRGYTSYLNSYNPDVSPDGTRIVYSTTRDRKRLFKGFFPLERTLELETSDLDGEFRHHLTNNDEHDVQPTWSPQGDRIAFLRMTPESQIWTIGPEGEAPKLLRAVGKGEYLLGDAMWSPDGSNIAFMTRTTQSAERGDGHFNLYTVNADGSTVERSFSTSQQPPETPGYLNHVLVGAPSRSPRDGRVSFVIRQNNPEEAGPEFNLHIVDPEKREHTTIQLDIRELEEAPTWGPKGETLLMGAPKLGTHSKIILINPDTEEQTVLADGTHPAWSPDRDLIAIRHQSWYDARDNAGRDWTEPYLSTMKPDGTEQRVLVYRHINAENYVLLVYDYVTS